MKTGVIIKNSFIIAAILGVAFLSQQPWVKTNSKNYVYSQGVAKNGNEYIKKASDWFSNNISSKILGSVSDVGGEVVKGKAAIESATESAKNELENQKNNFLQNSFDSTKKFIAAGLLNGLGVKPEDLVDHQNPVCPK